MKPKTLRTTESDSASTRRQFVRATATATTFASLAATAKKNVHETCGVKVCEASKTGGAGAVH